MNTLISLTPAAQQHFEHVLKSDPKAKGIRLALKTTGCSGKSYEVTTTEAGYMTEENIQLGSIVLWVDKDHLASLDGLNIDLVQEGPNYRIVYSNPNATGVCGCGESFTID